MHEILNLELFIDHEREGTYFTLPFMMPPDTESLTLVYRYPRYLDNAEQAGAGVLIARREANIIDLGLIAPDGTQAGTSGSDKTRIVLSETYATPGYHARALTGGEWEILVGAYKVALEGVTVVYELSFTPKTRRLYKGDLHTHTVASDGVLTAEELGWRAVRHGLDFLAITDHNQMAAAEALPQIAGLTLIPGVEWTHYRGHASMLGTDCPYDVPFAANTAEEVRLRFESAHKRGALICIDHPFEKGVEFKFDIHSLQFDCLEVWNGPMRESNLRAVGWWQSLLEAGQKIPICGGSDYHRDTPFIFPGGPTTCVYALSRSTGDVLTALKQGHSYITFSPSGPSLQMTAGAAILGDTVLWSDIQELDIRVDGLLAGDIIRVVSGKGSNILLEAASGGSFQAVCPVAEPGFVRLEILRSFLPGVPMLPALISNPIYFEG